MELQTISTEYQAQQGGYFYRFFANRLGVIVKRTKVDSMPMWSHGVLTEIYDQDAGRFVPACKSGTNLMFANLDAAIKAVENI